MEGGNEGDIAAAGAAFDPRRFVTSVAGLGHGGLVGTRLIDLGPDWVELAFDHAPHLVGDAATGILASGPILTLMDMATSMAVLARDGSFRAQATLDLRLDYLRPAVPGRTIHGRGECYRIGRRVAFVRGQAHDGDPANPLAHATGTFMFTEVQP